MDSTTSRASAVWQVAFVIVSGLVLAVLIQRLPIAAVALPVAIAFFAVFMLRPDLALLTVLFARASTDALVLAMGSVVFGQRRALDALLNPNAGLILILVAGGGLYILSRSVPFLSLPGGRLLTLLLLTGLVGTLRSQDVLNSFNEWLPVVSALIVYALAAHAFREPRRTQRLIDVLAASFVFPALFGYYQLATGQGFVIRGMGVSRIYGTFVHPNPFGLYLVLIISIFVCQALMQSGNRKRLAWGVVVTAVPLLLATFARFAWIGMTMVIMTVGLLRSRRMLVVLVPVVILALGVLPALTGRFADPLGGSFADRVEIWSSLVRQWIGATGGDQGTVSTVVSRLTGLGPGSVGSLTARTRGIPYEAHNDYVRVLTEYGILGLVLYLLLIVVLIRFAYRTLKPATGTHLEPVVLSFFALTLAYPVMSLTSNLFAATYNQVYFWTLAGLTAAASQMRAPTEQTWPSDEEPPQPGSMGSQP
jgi:hypothetical protein